MLFSFRPARQLAVAAGLLGFAALAACNSDRPNFDTTKSGIEYKIYKKAGGKFERRTIGPEGDPTYKTRIGKFLTAYIQSSTAKDSVLDNTRKQFGGMVVPLQLAKVDKMGGPEEAYSLLQPGDSGVFRFKLDSLFKGRPIPPPLKNAGKTIQLSVQTVKLIEEKEAMALQQSLSQKMQMEQQRKMMESPEYQAQKKAMDEQRRQEMAKPETQAQFQKDDAALQAYAKQNNLQVQKTPSGLYYVITQPGTGEKAKAGQMVSVHYTGSLLSGKVFDSSAKQGKPIDFPLGQGQVIPGWDEGIALLNKGSKAVFLIPSPLAYGPRAMGTDIPANSPLRFEVELVDVK